MSASDSDSDGTRPSTTQEGLREVLWRHRHLLVLGIGVWLWWVMFYRLGALRHDRFWTFGFDLGLFNQAAWLVAHFKHPFMTLRGLDVWGHHGNFIFILFAPFYWLGGGPKFLLAAQLTSQAAGGVGIYLLARDRMKGTRWPGVVLAAALLAHPSMQFLSWEYFHPETFAIGPLILAYWAARTGRWKTFWWMAVLAMACKEDVTLVFLVLGFVLMRRREFRRGAIVSGVALAWYLAVTKLLIPWRNPAGPFYEEHFYSNYGGSIGSVVKTVLRHPSRLWHDATAHNRLMLYWRLWAPVAFVPFLAPEVLALMLPMFFVIVLTWMMLRSRGRVAQMVGVVAVFASLALFTFLGSISSAIPGSCGIIASLLMSLPQIRYAMRHGRGPGVSVLGWALGGLAAAMWFVYGIGMRQIPVVINTGIQTVLIVAVVGVLLNNPTHSSAHHQHDAMA